MAHDIDMDLESLIEDIRELAAMPEFKKALIYKVRELKVLLDKDIEALRDIDEMLGLREMSGSNAMPKKIGGIKGQPFQLKRIGENTWIPSLSNISDQRNVHEIISAEISEFITRYGAHVGIPVMRPDLTLPGLKGRKFSLVFEKERDDLFSGTISEIVAGSENKPGKKETGTDLAGVQQRLRNIKQLFQYLVKYDDLYCYYISDFFVRWKPLIDNNVIETNA